jgi:hypothetical protein
MACTLKTLEERAASAIRELERRDACFSRVELISGEDDGRNKTYNVFEVFGVLLPRTSERVKRYMRERHVQPYGGGSVVTALGAYATKDGIVIQFHKAVVNNYGSTVKDYAWFSCLSFEVESRLEEGRLATAQAEEIVKAVEEDVREIEEVTAALSTRSYKVEIPYRGHVIAVCPKCSEVIEPKCKESTRFYDALVFVHEHRPAFIVLERGGARSDGEVPEQLFEIIRELWLRDGEKAAVEIEKVAQIWLQQRKEREYEEAMRAFFLSRLNTTIF